ncbi:MAG: hypothetical protein GC200_11150 [Tepidisphaera sp.]|nr:hypothetical protein [Tepidisphaera sp.]
MKREMLAAAVVSAFAVASFAQDTLPFGGEIVIPASQVKYANPPLRGGYQSRALAPVYDNISSVFANGTGGAYLATEMIMEDVSFVGGPWALPYSNPRVIQSASAGVAVLNTPTSSSTDSFFLVFWNPADVNFNGGDGPGTNMIRSGATPLAAYSFDLGTVTPGFVWQFTFTGLNVTVPATANGVYVQAGWCNSPAGPITNPRDLSGCYPVCGATDRGMAIGSCSLGLLNPACVGSTLPDYGRDSLSALNNCCADRGIFIGRPSTDPAACNEHRPSVSIGSTPAAYQLLLEGDVVAPPACNPDVNQDGATDQGDVDYLINVIAGGENPNNINPDFNQDGASDQGDIDALINTIASGQCP